MFDLDSFIAGCQEAVSETDPRRAVREVLQRALERPSAVADALGAKEGGLRVVHNAPNLTILNVIWAPGMNLPPHDHRMWAAIGIYGGAEDNTLYRRGPERIEAAGGRLIAERDILLLGADAIHSVANPERRFTGAIHVYGGDFVNTPRSQWDPDTLLEEPYDLASILERFAKANAEWAAQARAEVELDTEIG